MIGVFLLGWLSAIGQVPSSDKPASADSVKPAIVWKSISTSFFPFPPLTLPVGTAPQVGFGYTGPYLNGAQPGAHIAGAAAQSMFVWVPENAVDHPSSARITVWLPYAGHGWGHAHGTTRFLINDVFAKFFWSERGPYVCSFPTPPLEPGKSCTYAIGAELSTGGETYHETRQITVASGQHVTLDFTNIQATGKRVRVGN